MIPGTKQDSLRMPNDPVYSQRNISGPAKGDCRVMLALLEGRVDQSPRRGIVNSVSWGKIPPASRVPREKECLEKIVG